MCFYPEAENKMEGAIPPPQSITWLYGINVLRGHSKPDTRGPESHTVAAGVSSPSLLGCGRTHHPFGEQQQIHLVWTWVLGGALEICRASPDGWSGGTAHEARGRFLW